MFQTLAHFIYDVFSVFALYSTNTAQAIPNATTTIINFEDETLDPNNLVTTGASWKFTAQVAGQYYVCACVSLEASSGWGQDEKMDIYLRKNGATYCTMCSQRGVGSGGSSFERSVNGGALIYLQEDDYIDISCYQDSDNSLDLNGTTTDNWVTIVLVGREFGAT